MAFFHRTTTFLRNIHFVDRVHTTQAILPTAIISTTAAVKQHLTLLPVAIGLSLPEVAGQSLPTFFSKGRELGTFRRQSHPEWWILQLDLWVPSLELFPVLYSLLRVCLWIVINILSFPCYVLNSCSLANISFKNTPDLLKSFPKLCGLSV